MKSNLQIATKLLDDWPYSSGIKPPHKILLIGMIAEALSEQRKAGYKAGKMRAAEITDNASTRAYCDAIVMAKHELCLGEEAKIRTGIFALENLKALEAVRSKFGESFGLADGAKAIRAEAEQGGGK